MDTLVTSLSAINAAVFSLLAALALGRWLAQRGPARAWLALAFGSLLLEPHAITVGASGAIFGLMGAAFFEMRHRGMNPFETGIGFLIVINLALGLFIKNISIGGHVGGLIGGALAITAFQYGDRLRQPALGYAGCVVIAVAAAVAGVAVSDMTGLGSPHIG